MDEQMIDIGHGVAIEIRYHEGVMDGVHYTHPKPADGSPCFGYASVKPAWPNGWDVLQLEPLTLSPSLLCLICQHHGFIRDGKWVPA